MNPPECSNLQLGRDLLITLDGIVYSSQDQLEVEIPKTQGEEFLAVLCEASKDLETMSEGISVWVNPGVWAQD